MRNKSKITTLESRFPLLSIEQGCMVSKDADITVAFRVELPELFTVTSNEYASMHAAWHKAVNVLPNFSIVHKQDWFIKEGYHGQISDGRLGFLACSSERHFNERPYLHHRVYLFLTKSYKQRMARQSNFSALCRGHLIPKEITDRDGMVKFVESVEQFEHIINETGHIRLTRMTEEELAGTKETSGLLDRYFSLSDEQHAALEDIRLGTDLVRVGDNMLCLHTLSDTDDLPTNVCTDSRYERLSTDRSDCRLSFASPVGLMLSCNHIYNQYLFLEDSDANLERFEKQARNMHSLARYSRSNQINEEWIQEYLNIAHSQGRISIRAHFNVLAWSSDKEELRQIKNDVGAALAKMECKPRHNTIDAATLYWAGIPGNAADFPAEESFYTFIEPALCFFTAETNYKDSLSPFGLKMADRLSGKPIHLDISDLPMKKGVITNRNKFILGPSGSGKSFFTNHMVRQYYEQGAHVLLVDTGNSYQGLCSLIHRKTKSEDGIYFTYTDESPISFNPFYTEDYFFDVEKRESICTLLLTLWKSADEHISKTEAGELGSAVNAYIGRIRSDRSIIPCFNTFYEFLRDVYREDMRKRDIEVTLSDFNINNLLTTLKQYYKGGRYDFLLNSDKNIDLLSKRFIVFEIDQVKDNKDLFPVVTIIIMEAFINKMRRLKGVRKMILIEEAWKAIASANMADYIKYLYKTVRKYFGEAIVVTQEVDDIISSPIVKESIINNSDCKILLDQRKYMTKFDGIQAMLGLSEKEKSQILSINQDNDPNRLYKEVWIGLGGMQSAVYATEVSTEEYLAYTTEETEKLEVMQRTAQLGGDIENAIRQLALEKRNEKPS